MVPPGFEDTLCTRLLCRTTAGKGFACRSQTRAVQSSEAVTANLHPRQHGQLHMHCMGSLEEARQPAAQPVQHAQPSSKLMHSSAHMQAQAKRV